MTVCRWKQKKTFPLVEYNLSNNYLAEEKQRPTDLAVKKFKLRAGLHRFFSHFLFSNRRRLQFVKIWQRRKFIFSMRSASRR